MYKEVKTWTDKALQYQVKIWPDSLFIFKVPSPVLQLSSTATEGTAYYCFSYNPSCFYTFLVCNTYILYSYAIDPLLIVDNKRGAEKGWAGT